VDGGAEAVAAEEDVLEEEEFDLADLMGEELEESVSNADRLKQAELEIAEAKKKAAEEKAKVEEDAKKAKKKKAKKSKKAKKAATNEEL
jgi:uncharacterized membrane protein YukC